jgi:hypothetical protein
LIENKKFIDGRFYHTLPTDFKNQGIIKKIEHRINIFSFMVGLFALSNILLSARARNLGEPNKFEKNF